MSVAENLTIVELGLLLLARSLALIKVDFEKSGVKAFLANINIITCGALKPWANDWLSFTHIAFEVLVENVLIHLIL